MWPFMYLISWSAIKSNTAARANFVSNPVTIVILILIINKVENILFMHEKSYYISFKKQFKMNKNMKIFLPTRATVVIYEVQML